MKDQDVERIRADIKHARAWAREHFNADQEGSTLLDPPCFDVEFPDVHKMTVWPRFMGMRINPSAKYIIVYKEGRVGWMLKGFFSGKSAAWLEVPEHE